MFVGVVRPWSCFISLDEQFVDLGSRTHVHLVNSLLVVVNLVVHVLPVVMAVGVVKEVRRSLVFFVEDRMYMVAVGVHSGIVENMLFRGKRRQKGKRVCRMLTFYVRVLTRLVHA